MMSYPTSEDLPPRYETLMSSTPSVSNVPVTSYFQNVGPSPPMFYVPPSNQTWNLPAVAPQWQLSTVIPQNVDPSLPFFQTFLKGKPKALGILVIVAAILEIGLGIAVVFTRITIMLISGIPFWGPVFYIIAGSLTLGAQKKPNVCLIKGSLGLNIISSIFSMIAVILNIINFLTVQNTYFYCHYDYYYDDYEVQELCQPKLYGAYAVLFLLLVINLLLFCVTVSTSVFGCRSLSKVQSVIQVYMLPNDVTLAMNPGAVPVPVTTASTYAQSLPSAPPYSNDLVKV